MDALSKISRIVVVVVTVLAVMQTLGFSISGLLAFGGMGGIAVGFAAKDLLANFFGGLMIHLDRPFNVGELVRSPDKQIEGKVEHIGWRQTRIRTTNMTLIYVPNALFTANVVENPSRMSHRRIRETIGLRYDDLAKIGAIVEDVKTMLQNHPDIDNSQETVVAFDQFADSSLNLILQAFCKTTKLAPFHARQTGNIAQGIGHHRQPWRRARLPHAHAVPESNPDLTLRRDIARLPLRPQAGESWIGGNGQRAKTCRARWRALT